MGLAHLSFDTTDAGTIVDTHSVGAHVRAGLGGAIVTYHGNIKTNSTTDAFVPGDVTAGSDTITLTGHGFFSGDKVRFTTDTTLPDPLAVLTDYWVIYVDANTIKVATSQSNAELGIAIDLIDGGTGNHTINAQSYDIRALDVHVVSDLSASKDSVAAWTFDGSGNAITSTGGALDVNLLSPVTVDTKVDGVYDGVTNTNPDNVGLISHVRGAAPADADQTFRSTGGAASSDAVVAADVQGIDTNSFNMLFNGVTWDRATGTGGVADVSDSALADSTLIATPKDLVAATAADVIASPLANRKYVWLLNNHNRSIFIGGTGVTASTGFPLPVDAMMELRAGPAVVIKAITEATTATDKNLRTLELS